MRLTRISTHSPRVGRTNGLKQGASWSSISTHSPRVGRTTDVRRLGKLRLHFNSLAPCGANLVVRLDIVNDTNFNSLAPCGANRA